MSVLLATKNYSFSGAKIRKILIMVFFFRFLVVWREKQAGFIGKSIDGNCHVFILKPNPWKNK